MIPLIPIALTAFQAVRILNKSNLNEKELVVLECFLLLMEKEGLLSSGKSNVQGNGIEGLVQNSENSELIRFFKRFIKPISDKSGKLFVSKLCRAVSDNTEHIEEIEILKLFDGRLENYVAKQISGDALQPDELTILLNSFLPKKNNQSYYNPYAGLASLALDLPADIKYYGEELNQHIWLLAKMRMMIYNCSTHFQFENVNSIEKWQHEGTASFDYISFNPPFNLKLDESFSHFLPKEYSVDNHKANSLIVSQAFKKLNEGGFMTFVMPNGFLTSSASNDFAFRKYLVENNYIKFIISLPERIFRFTSIPVNVIVLSKHSSDSNNIRFVDGSSFYYRGSGKYNTISLKSLRAEINREGDSKYAKFIKSEVVAENGYNLSVDRYVFEESIPTLKEAGNLMKISDLISLLPIEKPHLNEAKLIDIEGLSDDSLQPILDVQNLPLKEVQVSYSVLKENALLIALSGDKIKPTLFQPANVKVVYARENISAFKINANKILPEYLVLALYKDYIQAQLKRLRSGSGIQRIRKEDFLNEIKIIVPSLIAQEREVGQAYYEVHQKQIAEVRRITTDHQIDVADENSFLRHQIAGSVKSLRNAFKSVKNILDNEVEPRIPDLYTLKADEKLMYNLGNYLTFMERDLGSVTKALQKTGTEIELTDLEIEKIELISFVEDYRKELKSRNGKLYTVEIKKDEAALLENAVKRIFIQGDREKLRQMFDNIIENAVKHGFEHKINPLNKIVFEFLYGFNQSEVQLDISNSGKPFPKNYSLESFVRRGSSSGKNAGDGTGGWFINEVMKLHNGNFGFTDNSGPEKIDGDLITIMELTVPITIEQ